MTSDQRRYRTSGLRLFILLFFGTIISLSLATGKSSEIKVFFGVEAIFIAMAFAAWSYTEVHFEGDQIVRTIFFFFTTKRPISKITQMHFDADEDTFGGRTAYVTIEFSDAKRFTLFDFSKADLREIVERISAVVPNVTDAALRKHLDENRSKDWKTVLRPGDGLLLTVGALFVIVAVLLWVLQRFSISI